MKEEFIYIISTQRGQGSPEIYSLWNTYESAIKAYHQFVINLVRKHNYRESFVLDRYFLYKFPVNVTFTDDNSSCKYYIKLQKSCKYRMKFDSFENLSEEYNYIIRGNKLERITSHK